MLNLTPSGIKLTPTGVKINTNLVWTSHNTGGVKFNTGVFAVLTPDLVYCWGLKLIHYMYKPHIIILPDVGKFILFVTMML